MFVTPEPWEMQYFSGYETSIDIPVDDVTAYTQYPRHNWVYNKLTLMQTQGIDAFPMGVVPSSFPVFMKPITNLWGMGIGAKELYQCTDQDYQPGYMWMSVLSGTHYSIDVAVINGMVMWNAAAVGEKDSYGSFSVWHLLPETPDNLLERIIEWSLLNMNTYTGIMNFEFIGDTMIECHLRMTTQWVDLYPSDFLPAVITLYEHGTWDCSPCCAEGYSFVARTEDARVYPMFEYMNDNISSYQLTYRQGLNVDCEANDEVSYRIAVVNGTDYTHCKDAVTQLKEIIVGGVLA